MGGRYRLQRKLGGGSFGAVYQGNNYNSVCWDQYIEYIKESISVPMKMSPSSSSMFLSTLPSSKSKRSGDSARDRFSKSVVP